MFISTILFTILTVLSLDSCVLHFNHTQGLQTSSSTQFTEKQQFS